MLLVMHSMYSWRKQSWTNVQTNIHKRKEQPEQARIDVHTFLTSQRSDNVQIHSLLLLWWMLLRCREWFRRPRAMRH